MRASDDSAPFSGASLGLYDLTGHRKYLTNDERAAFLSAAELAPREVRTFCGMLVYTGCRISEALALTADRVDLQASVVVFETLKKRQSGIYRAVPVPEPLVEVVDLVHGVRDARARRDGGRKHRLWPWSRMTGWRRVIEVMVRAEITGPHATPKGLRHGFGVAAVGAGIPLNLVRKWLGHAQLSTMAIYADAMGTEECDIARRLWGYGSSDGVNLRVRESTVSSAHLPSYAGRGGHPVEHAGMAARITTGTDNT